MIQTGSEDLHFLTIFYFYSHMYCYIIKHIIICLVHITIPDHRPTDLQIKSACSSPVKPIREEEFLRKVFYLVENKPDGNLQRTNLDNSFMLHFGFKKYQLEFVL